ncbi:4-(cytidine 5'-diphospho)-2-C-methyl-D-erythritol kinase [Acetobacter sp. AC2005]|uniref:4-(cytidine 5'-diphospho)-2-C-methyl-D-erythritol kinase n=1 Tax=Acetobacter sp. AC2005 TaxID=3134142 RepID=UPI0030D04019
MTVDVLDVATTPLTEIAPAKINLYLHVTGRRPDGYHLLDSLVVFAGAGDVLHYEPGPQPLHLKLEGRFGLALGADAAGADNLVMKAAAVLRDLAGPQANVQGGCLVLEKNLPVASGIGGGSADAAATLRLLNRAWDTQVDEPTLFRVAETLGADVPVCLLSQTVRMEGIGETLTPGPRLPECGLVLVNCGQAVSTPEVFRKRTGDFVPRADLPQSWPNSAAMVATLKALENSLEAPACSICPPVKKVLADIAAQPECQLARMSGSGATCFGVFPTVEAAREAADRLADAHAAWWVWGGALA